MTKLSQNSSSESVERQKGGEIWLPEEPIAEGTQWQDILREEGKSLEVEKLEVLPKF